ncbi:hypothetical protein HMI54_002543, partial [Coelomomyces lativittatus]
MSTPLLSTEIPSPPTSETNNTSGSISSRGKVIVKKGKTFSQDQVSFQIKKENEKKYYPRKYCHSPRLLSSLDGVALEHPETDS